MNREIKFRAYESTENQMIILENSGLQCFDFEGSFSLGFTVDGYSGFYAHEQYERASKEANKFPIMQFTGLKDKNGVEIYEGDILVCHEYDSSDCGKRIVQTFKNAVVGFDFGNYYYYPKGNMMQPHQLLMYAYQPEVIGNIHQNPELL